MKPNTSKSFKFGLLQGKIAFQNGAWGSAKYICNIQFPNGRRHSCSGYCKPLDFNSNTHSSNSVELWDLVCTL